MKYKILVSLFLSALPFASFSQSPLILNGVPAEKGEFPFFVALNTLDGAKAGHYCGAALINKEWIITAAHCADTEKKLVALVGLEQYAPSAVYKDKVEIAQTFLPPGWSSAKKDMKQNDKNKPGVQQSFLYDIALLKLSRPANSKSFIKVNGIDETITLPIGTSLTVTGFGKNENDLNPDILMKKGEEVLQDKLCIDVPPGYPATNYDPKYNICSGNSTGAAYRGDSGGPLMVKDAHGDDVLVGLVSRSLIFPAEQNTRVSAQSQWIKETIEAN